MTRVVTVVCATTGATADVCLDASGERTLTEVLPDLTAVCGARGQRISLDGVVVDPRTRVAELNDGAVLVLDDLTPLSPPAPPVCVLEVAEGVDAGRIVALPTGRHMAGREGAVTLADGSTSRRHAEIVVTHDGVTVTDLGSPNGSVLDGRALAPGEATPWPATTPLHVGDAVLIHGRAHAPGAITSLPDGATVVHRSPRLTSAAAPRSVAFPAPPAPVTVTSRFPVLASLGPVVAGVALAAFLRRWEFLAFAVMSPLVVLGQAASDRLAARQDRRRNAAAHAAAVAAAEQELAMALESERAERRAAAPDLAQLVRAATQRSELLWQRTTHDGDALVLRMGVGDVAAATTVTGADAASVHDVPVVVDLRAESVVGIVGPAADARALARSLLVQAVALHGPAALRLTVVAPGSATAWRWTQWLPHVRADAATPTSARFAASAEEVDRVIETMEPAGPDAHHLVVIDGVVDGPLAERLRRYADTSVLWVCSDERPVPASCTTIVRLQGRSFTVTRNGRTPASGRVDALAADVAEQVARALAPLRDAQAAATSLPRVVRWSHLQDMPVHDAASTARVLRERWRRGPTMHLRIGASNTGTFEIDLIADGPHALVAGTTGAGKSELLQTLVASLVAANSPADLRLLLIDFKGGTAFGAFRSLPHTLDVLTDLDPATTSRALRSISAELRRREQLLAGAGVADLTGYRIHQSSRGDTTPLPRLLIVVDEFATLADDLPDFLGGLVAIAQRGRALGVHLVLATQRPEGAVSADIRANTNLRVCLAVAREAESRDVIDSPRAFAISRSTPGRALVRIGSADLVEVQCARISERTQTAHRPVVLSPLGWSQTSASPAADTTAASELDVLVDAVRAAHDGVESSHTLWLAPLPTTATLGDLPADRDQAVIGMVDLPDEQRQPPLSLDVSTHDPLLLSGTARSGRTTACESAVLALASALSPDELHVHAVDTGRSLDGLAALPHTGAVIDAADAERVERLFLYLTAQVQSRRGSSATGQPHLVLVIDGWEALSAAAGDADGARLHDLALRLISDGPGAGLRVIVTSDRAGMTGRLASAIADRYVLRLADTSDYAAIGLALREAPRRPPPGRGIRVVDLATVQFAMPDERARARAQRWAAPAVAPRRFDPLPARIPLDQVVRSAGGLVIGVRSDDLAPAVLDLAHAAGTFLVAGPPRSGRSTVLLNLAAQAEPRTVVALCARQTSPLLRYPGLAFVGDAQDPEQVERAVAGAVEGATLLVDDIDLLDDQVALSRLEDAVRRARDGQGFVVLAGTTDAMASTFRGPVAQARRSRVGLLLHPEGLHDGELLGLRLRRRSAQSDPPGRGLFAINGAVLNVQVPDPG